MDDARDVRDQVLWRHYCSPLENCYAWCCPLCMQLLDSDNLQAVVAFHKWRHSCLRSTYRKKVQEVLNDVAEEERLYNDLKRANAELMERWARLPGESAQQEFCY